jgi:hypothetical protein
MNNEYFTNHIQFFEDSLKREVQKYIQYKVIRFFVSDLIEFKFGEEYYKRLTCLYFMSVNSMKMFSNQNNARYIP